MPTIDTHCHLYLPEFDNDRDIIIQRAISAGTTKFFLPNIDQTSIDPLLSLSSAYPSICYPMMGLHPCSVKENWEEEIKQIEQYLFHKNETKFWGIGETGLDYYWDKSFVEKQKENFQLHINWAKELRLPIIIHSRDAADDCIETIKKNQEENLRGIFHCFSGTIEEAHRIISMDFYLGIGGVVTYKNSGLDKIIAQLELDHIVLETDAPYLAPVPFRGKRNESSYLKQVVQKISEIKNISEEEVEAVTTVNAQRVFGLES